MTTIKATYFTPNHKGVVIEKDGVSFSTDQVDGNDCGVIIYDENNKGHRFPFSEKGRRGCLYGLKVNLPLSNKHSYHFYKGDELIIDHEAKILLGNHQWGINNHESKRAGFYFDDFDWENDTAPGTLFTDSIIYGINTRAFTMHRSSGVKNKGLFSGIIEKIPYLCDLGITAIELLPAYDFDEYETAVDKQSGEEIVRLNCWGFKKSQYYAPKSAYAGGERPDHAFKNMVKAMHRNGIEVFMYFYFPVEFNRTEIIDILRFWVIEYHIDGIHLLGVDMPMQVIIQDRILSGTKIIYNEYDYRNEKALYNNTAVFRDHFMTEVRRVLKGDENMVSALLYHHRHYSSAYGNINYLANYNGFSLFDMTAYDKKRNETNLEENQDGTDYNYSWNCGVEGPSRKKGIIDLRTKQLKNALSLLLLSQAIPFIFNGDEFGNTRNGNNNAYCHDNDTGWIKWSNGGMSQELLSFTKELIAFRKKHPILHMPTGLRILDWQRCGYPDISYHGKDAWRPDLNPLSRTVGIMLCGKYARHEDKSEDDFIFIAVNMHWREHSLALPHLPKELKWHLVYQTDLNEAEFEKTENDDGIMMSERSICVLISVPDVPPAD